MREGYAWMIHFVDGWNWLDETIYSSVEECYAAIDKKGYSHDTICIDYIKETNCGMFDKIHTITEGTKFAFDEY